jgi:hypothetical protein
LPDADELPPPYVQAGDGRVEESAEHASAAARSDAERRAADAAARAAADVKEGLAALSAATGKSVEKLLAASDLDLRDKGIGVDSKCVDGVVMLLKVNVSLTKLFLSLNEIGAEGAAFAQPTDS